MSMLANADTAILDLAINCMQAFAWPNTSSRGGLLGNPCDSAISDREKVIGHHCLHGKCYIMMY